MPSTREVRDTLERNRRELVTVAWSGALVCLVLVGVGWFAVYYCTINFMAGGYWVEGMLETALAAIALGVLGAWLTANLVRYAFQTVHFRLVHGDFELTTRELEGARRILARLPVSEDAARRRAGLGDAGFERVLARLALASVIERESGRIEAGLVSTRRRRVVMRPR